MSQMSGDTSMPTCGRHEGQPFMGKCGACGAAICRECRTEFGYYCSAECRERSRREIDPAARAETARALAEVGRSATWFKRGVLVLGLLILGGVGHAVWRAWLRPLGKVAWRADAACPLSGLQWLPGAEGTLVLRRGGSLARILPTDAGLADLPPADADLAGCGEPLARFTDGALYAHGGLLLRLRDGAVAWRHAFAGPVVAAAVADDAVVAAWQEAGPDADEDDLLAEPPAVHLAGLAREDGKILWEKDLPDAYDVQHVVAAGGQYLCSFAQRVETGWGMVSVFRAGDAATGKDRWQAKTPSFNYGFPPCIAGDLVLFHADGKLVALAADGRSRRWEVDAPDLFSREQMTMAHDCLYLSLGERFACVGLADGAIRWERAMPFSCDEATLADGAVYLLVAEERQGTAAPLPVALPPDMEDLQDINPLAQGGPGIQPGIRTEIVLLCLDAETGEERWRRPKLRGDVVAGDGQLFVVTDGVRHYGGMAMLGGGAATTTVRALDPRSGQDRFARSHPFSMRGPYRIQAGNLLGTVYDGEGARGGAFGSSVAEDAALGVVAIRGR